MTQRTILGALLLTAIAATARAATFHVDTTEWHQDAVPGDGLCAGGHRFDCSLRAALQEVNALATWDVISEHVIVIPAGRYSIPVVFGGGGAPPFVVAASVTLAGAGAPETMCPRLSCRGVPLEAATVLDGGGFARILEVAPPRSWTWLPRPTRVTIRDLAVDHGGTTDLASRDVYGHPARTGGGLKVHGLTEVRLENVAFHNNSAEAGGAIDNAGHLSLDRVAVTRNRAREGSSTEPLPGTVCGGAIRTTGALRVRRSVIAHNTSLRSGGGICGADVQVTESAVRSNVATLAAGGLWVLASGRAETRVSRSLIAWNRAGTAGGGLYNSGNLHVSNSTLAYNEARTGGGAAWTENGPVSLDFVTVSGNESDRGPGGLGGIGGSISTAASVFAGNDCLFSGTAMTSRGYNAADAARCGISTATDVFTTDLRLAALDDNGGPTATMALLDGSPALDLVPAAACRLTQDQRRLPRPAGSGCDAGAYEQQLLFFRWDGLCCGLTLQQLLLGVNAAASTAQELPPLVGAKTGGDAEAVTLARALAAQSAGLAKQAQLLSFPSADTWRVLADLRDGARDLQRTADRLAARVKGLALGRTNKVGAELREVARTADAVLHRAAQSPEIATGETPLAKALATR